MEAAGQAHTAPHSVAWVGGRKAHTELEILCHNELTTRSARRGEIVDRHPEPKALGITPWQHLHLALNQHPTAPWRGLSLERAHMEH